MADSFFIPQANGQWLATENTIGPWSAEHQHAGPPAALLGRALESVLPDGFRFARVTCEILRPVVVGQLLIEAELSKQGRAVCYARASLRDSQQRVLMQATGLAIRETQFEYGELTLPVERDLPLPDAAQAFDFSFFRTPVGYHTAMELRLADGEPGAGPTAMWMRMKIPLVPDEQPSPLQRVLCAADSGNGVSMVLDKSKFNFMNPDLCVYLHRYPQGEWVCLDAATTPDVSGIGLAESQLRDESGPIGRGLQSLFIAQYG
ncbi:MAG: thioesterase family protein [Salinisphaeraceae bacterium]|nr:thioesterase family protein [Salinisphaeraceae bacterium]